MNVLPLCAFVCAINISAQLQSGITDRMGFPNVVSKYHEIVNLNNWRLHMYLFELLLSMQNVLTLVFHNQNGIYMWLLLSPKLHVLK